METITNLPPKILQSFSSLLLLYGTIKYYSYVFEHVIIPLSNKKIRFQDVGKKREFEELKKEFMDLYGSKEKEETDFDAETKKMVEERPHLSSTGIICKFRRP